MHTVDSLIFARWVIPVDDHHSVLEDHAVAISEDRIIDVLPAEQARQTYEAASVHQFDTHAVLPGLVNSHTHAAMSLFRGIADDLELMDWLQNHIWPAEQQNVNEAFCQLGTELAIAEMISGGTTCMNDMYFFPDVTARVCHHSGFRATVGLIVLDFPTIWANDPDSYIDKGLDLHDQYRDNHLISAAFAPHAPYTVSDQPLEKIRTLADELDLPVHMHVHETAGEVHMAQEGNGMRPLQRLDKLGLLTPSLLAVHMTQLDTDEITQLADRGCHVIHCPESNLKLASGMCPTAALLEAGVNVALGTDGAASNNDLDMFGEMRTAALLAKGVAGDACVVPAWQAIEMATRNGARALMLEDRIGSLEKGKQADIIAVDMQHAATTPVFDPVSHLVYCCNASHVSDSWIAGKQLMKQGQLTTLDSDDIKHRACALAETFSS